MLPAGLLEHDQEMFDFFKPIGRNPYHKKQPDGSTRHETEIAGDEAINFIRSCDKELPFCLSVSFNASHAEDSDKKDHFPYPKAVASLYEGMKMPSTRCGPARRVRRRSGT